MCQEIIFKASFFSLANLDLVNCREREWGHMRTRSYERQNNCLSFEMCSFCASGNLREGGSHCRESRLPHAGSLRVFSRELECMWNPGLSVRSSDRAKAAVFCLPVSPQSSLSRLRERKWTNSRFFLKLFKHFLNYLVLNTVTQF